MQKKMKQHVLKFILKLYKHSFSLFFHSLGVRCRFYPSCSEYAAISYSQYSCFKATKKVLYRLARCSPLTKGGIDYP